MSNSSGLISLVPPRSIKHNAKIPTLTVFNDIYDSKPSQNPIGYIPVYKENISLVGKLDTDSNEENDITNNDHEEDQGKEEIIDYEVTKFVDLKTFKNNDIVNQLLQVGIIGFKDLENPTIEQILNTIVNDGVTTDTTNHNKTTDDVDNNGNVEDSKDESVDDLKFVWTEVDDFETKFVYLRFDKSEVQKSLAKIAQLTQLNGLEILGTSVEFIVESNTKDLINDTLGKEYTATSIDKDLISDKIQKILDLTRNKKKVSADLDYVIDENELKDIRREDLPQLKKDIKEFRLKVLDNEKRKRQREALEEVKRSRNQLRQLFVKFQKETDSDYIPTYEEDDEDDSDGEDDGFTDEKYEELRVSARITEMLKEFNRKLNEVKREERRNKELIEELIELERYEDSLDHTIKPSYETGEGFHVSHHDRSAELKQDEQDRKDAEKEINSRKESENFLNSINIPLRVSLNQNNEEEEEGEDEEMEDEGEEEEEDVEQEVEESEEIDSDKLTISDPALDEILEKIKPKIDSYIEEFLGVKEDELLEYVLMIIKDTKSKTALVSELKETFDDDAVSIGEKIWNDLLENI